MKLDFLKLSLNERHLYIEQAANQKNVSPIIMEKDFWVCWLLNILFESEFAGSLVFKGGTSLSKVFGAIYRFSEDIDLSLSPTFLKLPEAATTRNQVDKWIKRAEVACEEAVQTQIMPVMEASVLSVLGNGQQRFEFLKDPNSNSPVLLFHYPSSQPTGFAYIKRSVKLEFGSLTDQQPTGRHTITPWIAEIFPKAFLDWRCEVTTLEIERSFWEKATILHAEYHRPLDKPIPDRYSRHYADTSKLAKHPEAIQAINHHDLRNQVVSWKSQFFGNSWASYNLAKPGTFRLVPPAERLPALRHDYQLMRDMYLTDPESFDDILTTLSNLEHRINIISSEGEANQGNVGFSQNDVESLPSLGEVLTKKKGDELVRVVREILAANPNAHDTSLNERRPLQLLIKANLDSRKKLELVESFIELGADIHSADSSGLTPYQVAIDKGHKAISDLLRSKGVRPMSPPGTGYVQHYNMYREIPLPLR
ncbi:MAG: nucleotidyl transferase AbiEii/AbiGii toxin family protein [Chlamydiales bacterium]|nr:nucleotidyl transferase AbiEii/AbiGii toxin family protein [Chlamydiales bacterium]